jgi:hypothetical protein
VVGRVINNDNRIRRTQPVTSHGNTQFHSHYIALYDIKTDIIAHVGKGEVCVTVGANHSTNGYMCKHVSICKETRRIKKCDAEVCNIVFSGGGDQWSHTNICVHRTNLCGR